MEIGKVFFEILSPPVLSKPLFVYVCTIIIHITYEWHAEARGGVGKDSLQLANEKSGWGTYSPLYLKISYSHYVFRQPHNISNCNI